MPTIRTLDGGTRTEGMPDSNSAHEPPYCEGPLHEMSLREIAEAFVKDPDADVAGLVERVLVLRKRSRKDTPVAIVYGLDALCDDVLTHVEGQ